MKLRLYHYWRSSSSWRVRWALALKEIAHQVEYVAVDLLSDAPESPEHRSRNPQGFVPVLEILDELDPARRFLTESVAIIEWLDETQSGPSILPDTPWLRAKGRQLAEIINSGTQPIQNPSVAAMYSSEPAQQKIWNRHWIEKGLAAYEAQLQGHSGLYSLGDQVSYPDLFLVPQCYNALRFDVDLKQYPKILAIHAAATQTEACRRADPEAFHP